MTTRFPTTTHTAGTTYSRAGLYALPAGDWSAAAAVKTAGGTLVQALAGGIFQAVAGLDKALFAAAETHKAAMTAAADPLAYDFSGDWPATYQS